MHNEYLQILGLDIGASPKDIKKAYRMLAKRYHPDVNKDENARAQFLRVAEAYKFLSVAGPRPNQESIRYDYDPQQPKYEDWREQAKRYARQKSREAAIHRQGLLNKIYFYFNYLNIAVLVFNVIIIMDAFLPGNPNAQRILEVSEVYYKPNPQSTRTHIYDQVVFDDFILRIDKDGVADIIDTKAMVYTSSILGYIKYAEVKWARGIKVIKPAYGIYYIYRIFVPIALFFGIGYYFLSSYDSNKITLVVVVTSVFLIQFIMFLTFEY